MTDKMEMPDVIYVDRGLACSEEIYPTDAVKYHHSRVVEALRKENEELKARLEIDQSHPYDGIYTRDETIKMLEANVAELKAKLDKAKWQPIETAPKDGEIDAFVLTKNDGWFHAYRGLNNRWSANDPRGGGDYYIHTEITHWMPLPDAPEKL